MTLRNRIARQFGFRPATPDDLPRLARWLAQPHVAGWCGDPESEAARIEADLGSDRWDMRIVTLSGRPFAFVRDQAANADGLPQFGALPRGARTLETFVGERDHHGRGLAQRYLRQRVLDLMQAGASLVAADPAPGNTRAVAAFRGAGFYGGLIVPGRAGAPVLVMTHTNRMHRRRPAPEAEPAAALIP